MYKATVWNKELPEVFVVAQVDEPVVRVLHPFISFLNSRTFGTRHSRQSSTCAPSGHIHGLHGGDSQLALSGEGQSKLKLSGNGNE